MIFKIREWNCETSNMAKHWSTWISFLLFSMAILMGVNQSLANTTGLWPKPIMSWVFLSLNRVVGVLLPISIDIDGSIQWFLFLPFSRFYGIMFIPFFHLVGWFILYISFSCVLGLPPLILRCSTISVVILSGPWLVTWVWISCFCMWKEG